ncbi:RNA polymerase sigma factor, sigma-70 family [Streptomyces sp. MnatMP-M77]|uniref:sigma-70 family RNA polymerase sigma factor n=1 Tax=unclassified Streptomyces TaxID=2593676 RepID=UPI00080582FF|nr:MULTISPECIES: sigma-70 family RNA polymerase sigma factor [unclassified Streptomyces]MYT82237.1 sigma-70 family RNA polymerase sigma factor [Streptomyces sp. SID8364]SBU98261.1 RNA polymerase sigma factor, sigma-70 family [Streptomyces sp. MnatMP-M77]SCE17079.1 RNA polymerase sigma factor, sigma-70 family [Streptomyces sp. OspMP-M43]
MGKDHPTALITAAQGGDQQAKDQLVSAYLPLLYNVVGRALDGHADVDDVVQETVLRMLRGLPELRDPERFRSWLVAIAMNEIRTHWRDRQSGAIPADRLDTAYDLPDPRADFVEVTILELGLTGQRRQVAEATRWLDEDDRALLSLWWLETAGHLSRAEVAAALELSPQHTAVRVQRMKAQLEAARVVVGALAAEPPCVLLEDIAAGWDGVPSALWRKRLARHARECTVCSGYRSGLVPAEGLLVGLALVPVAAAGAGAAPELLTTAAHLQAPGPDPHGAGAGRAERRRVQARRRRRNSAIAAVVAVAALGTGGTAVHLYTDGDGQDATTVTADAPAPRSQAPTSASPTSSPSLSPTPTSSPSPSASPSPSPSRTPKAKPKTSTPAPPAPTTAPAPDPDPPAPAPAAPAGTAGQVTDLVNAERAKEGCGPVTVNDQLNTAAQRHSADMEANDYFSHTSQDGRDPGDRITAAGYRWSTYGENIAKGQQTPADVMRSWMDSPGHRANILNCSFKEIGVGKQNSGGGPVWTQVFGAR